MEHSTEILQYLIRNTEGRVPVIASGGIFRRRCKKKKFDCGASLVRVWTGFIYEGPAIVKKNPVNIYLRFNCNQPKP